MSSSDAKTARRLRLLVGGFALLLLAGFITVHLARARAQQSLADQSRRDALAPAPVALITAKPAENGGSLTLPAQASAWEESAIYPRVSGYVASWHADIGDHVRHGESLAIIETPELDADLAAAQAKLNAAHAERELRAAELQFAETSYARWRDSPKGVVSEQEREDKKAQFATAGARLAQAEAQIKIDQAEVARLQAFQNFKSVTAPFDGIVTERHIDIGNLVSAGNVSSGGPLYHIAVADKLRVFVDVPQSAALDLMRSGAKAEIRADNQASVTASISRTSSAIDPQSRTFRAEIDLNNDKGLFLPGQYLQVVFPLSGAGMVEVPAASVLFRSRGPAVARIDSDGKMHLVPVQIGRDDGNFLALSQGVAAGDRLVLNINNQIQDGDPVEVTSLDGKRVAKP